MTETRCVHEPDARRYALYLDGALTAIVDYAVNGDAISFTRTYTQPAHRNRGLAAELVAFAVEDVEHHSRRHVVPMCWFVAEWFDKHPDKARLLAPRA